MRELREESEEREEEREAFRRKERVIRQDLSGRTLILIIDTVLL
jgi:hypothetical protein